MLPASRPASLTDAADVAEQAMLPSSRPASLTDAANEAGLRGTRIIKKKQPGGKTGRDVDRYDIFLSYRVVADSKLVEELWWRLQGMDIVIDGKTRKLRVFLDKKCLLSGESWEVRSQLHIPVALCIYHSSFNRVHI